MAQRMAGAIVGRMKWTPFSVLAVVGVGLACIGCDDLVRRLYNPKVKVRCQVMQGRCKFTNEGDPGTACVQVEVKRVLTGETIRSKPVCSGDMKSNEVRWVAIPWGEREPLVFCMGPDYKLDFAKECEATVLEEGSFEMPAN